MQYEIVTSFVWAGVNNHFDDIDKVNVYLNGNFNMMQKYTLLCSFPSQL